MKISVYTDGACTKNGRIGATASWAYYFPENPSQSDSGRVTGEQTNQRGELMGIHEAIKKMLVLYNPQETDIQIYTDSMYSKNCLTNWVQGWISKNWTTTQGKPVCHKDLIESTVKNLSCFKSFTVIHVLAHTGQLDEHSRNNEIVDKMATSVITPEKVTVTSSDQTPIDGLPLILMGPSVSESELVMWCHQHMSELDETSLNQALLAVLIKTVKLKGFDIVKQRLHRSTVYKLISANHLIVENS